jgi:hypothetical protein
MVASAVASALTRAARSTGWLASRSGIGHAALQRKLAAESDFTVAELADIAAALGIPVADLVPRLRESRDGDERPADR